MDMGKIKKFNETFNIIDVSNKCVDVGLNILYNKVDKEFYQVIQYYKCLDNLNYTKIIWNDLEFLIINIFDLEDLSEQRRNILNIINNEKN